MRSQSIRAAAALPHLSVNSSPVPGLPATPLVGPSTVMLPPLKRASANIAFHTCRVGSIRFWAARLPGACLTVYLIRQSVSSPRQCTLGRVASSDLLIVCSTTSATLASLTLKLVGGVKAEPPPPVVEAPPPPPPQPLAATLSASASKPAVLPGAISRRGERAREYRSGSIVGRTLPGNPSRPRSLPGARYGVRGSAANRCSSAMRPLDSARTAMKNRIIRNPGITPNLAWLVPLAATLVLATPACALASQQAGFLVLAERGAARAERAFGDDSHGLWNGHRNVPLKWDDERLDSRIQYPLATVWGSVP